VIVPLNLLHKPQALTKSFHEVVMCHEYFVNLRLIDTLYKVLRLMTTLDLAPNLAAFKAVQRIVARVNPKIAQMELDQIIDGSFVRNLEANGFMTELRKKVR
jgi:hypothetical protein